MNFLIGCCQPIKKFQKYSKKFYYPKVFQPEDSGLEIELGETGASKQTSQGEPGEEASPLAMMFSDRAATARCLAGPRFSLLLVQFRCSGTQGQKQLKDYTINYTKTIPYKQKESIKECRMSHSTETENETPKCWIFCTSNIQCFWC